MRSRLTKLVVLVPLLALSSVLAGCSAASGTPASSVVVANQRLTGSWRLQSFAPEVPLDLPLQAVLSAELGQMVVTFNQSQFSAIGPGINFNGRYVVSSADGEQLQVILYDPQGVGYHFSAQFAGNLLHFHIDDQPWAGVGALEHT
ncbi:MAG TPA: hypothetical protein VHV51_10585 [Polyangiaceae bacterium]|nr:hypothetical protein [Polyangiaceae bacterium]